jgi:hypothetical protein
MPTILRIGKYRFFFFSNEGNESPHIHIESDENYAKFWLEDIVLAKSVGYNAKELNEIRGIISENIRFIKDKWHEYFSN